MTTPVEDSNRFFKHIHMADIIPEVGSICTIAGWGTETVTLPRNLKFTSQAKIAPVIVKDRVSCAKDKPMLPEGAICYTWNTTGGSCDGDEGGPMIYEGRLVGILMRMKNCDANNETSFAVDIQQHLHWINEHSYRIVAPVNGGDILLVSILFIMITRLLSIFTPDAVQLPRLFDFE